jgi:hypothetical protein
LNQPNYTSPRNFFKRSCHSADTALLARSPLPLVRGKTATLTEKGMSRRGAQDDKAPSAKSWPPCFNLLLHVSWDWDRGIS